MGHYIYVVAYSSEVTKTYFFISLCHTLKKRKKNYFILGDSDDLEITVCTVQYT